jgi:hypothetical protein
VYVCICGAVIVLLFMIERCEFLLSCSLCSRRALGFGELCKYVLNACQSAVCFFLSNLFACTPLSLYLQLETRHVHFTATLRMLCSLQFCVLEYYAV